MVNLSEIAGLSAILFKKNKLCYAVIISKYILLAVLWNKNIISIFLTSSSAPQIESR